MGGEECEARGGGGGKCDASEGGCEASGGGRDVRLVGGERNVRLVGGGSGM